MTVHDGATNVVLNKVPPMHTVPRDFLREALFFEEIDRVVVGVRQKVFNVHRTRVNLLPNKEISFFF